LLRAFVAHWYAQRDGHTVTRRADISITRFASLLPHIFLYDYDTSTRDLTLRLAGEEIRRILPNSRPGTPLAQIMPAEFFTPVLERYRRVCEEPAIMLATGRVFLRLGGTGVGERVLLPLADPHGRVHQMLGATLYQIGDLLPDGSLFAREDVATRFFPLTSPSEPE
jgi:hypothetical protein